jgi:hypothetical protein
MKLYNLTTLITTRQWGAKTMSSLDLAKSVPVHTGGSVPNDEVVHIIGCNRISKRSIEGIAVEKYKSCGHGITFEDIQVRFSVKKNKVQRSLKHFQDKGVLFTAQSLISQGIFLLQCATVLEKSHMIYIMFLHRRIIILVYISGKLLNLE